MADASNGTQNATMKPFELDNGEVAELSRDRLCGLGSWRPKWLQKMANHNCYAVSFIIIGIVQGMIYAYFNGALTTIEKVFGISSRTMGLLLTGNDISQILCGMMVTHIGGKGSRPLYIAVGMFLTSAACFTYASCQLFWNGNIPVVINRNMTTLGMCSDSPLIKSLDVNDENSTGSPICIGGESNIASMVLFFVGQFISGVGSTALFSLGFTYMDDNIKKRNSPIYIGATISLRSLGPLLGYVLSSFCLKLHLQSVKPDYSLDDPRWLGRWWLGFVIIGTIQMIIAFPMLLFPKQLSTDVKVKPSQSTSVDDSNASLGHNVSPTFKDFLQTLCRLFKNPILVFNMASMGPVMFGVVGFATFMPKYLEAQFGQSAPRASIFTGLAGTLMMMFGTFLGGVVIWIFKPRTVYITGWNAFINLFFVLIIVIIMGFGCEESKFVGININQNSELEVTSPCSNNCNCDLKFDPVCVMGSQNFLSPCLAGCKEFNQTSDNKKIFYDCDCAFADWNTNESMIVPSATSGYCPNTRGKCSLFMPYIVLLGSTKLIAATARVGGLIVFVRSVYKPDKALAMALMGVIASIFGFIPGPIVFGALADSTCLIWETKACGQRGNCWLYAVDDLRFWYHALIAICFVVSFFFDILVCIYSKNLNLYDDNSPDAIPTFRFKKSESQVHDNKVTE